ncbi:Rha family transcriptional regulator [Listeria monocytogenes]|nr:Rha family transcriptional regulator [Listeria monocytogenes]
MEQLQQTINSREVAVMVGREHKEVLRDTRKIIDHLGESKIAQSYFIESTYINEQNKEQPCFDFTKKGCELYSTRMTGAKGTQFAVAYIERFNQMEEHIKTLDTKNLSPELQFMNSVVNQLASQELATKQLETKIDSVSEIVALNTLDWRKNANSLVNQVVRVQGGGDAHRTVRSEIYKEVERRAGANLSQRVTNKRRRMADEGVCKSKRDNLNQVDVISDDKKLVEIYLSVVKDFAINHKVWNNDF